MPVPPPVTTATTPVRSNKLLAASVLSTESAIVLSCFGSTVAWQYSCEGDAAGNVAEEVSGFYTPSTIRMQLHVGDCWWPPSWFEPLIFAFSAVIVQVVHHYPYLAACIVVGVPVVFQSDTLLSVSAVSPAARPSDYSREL
ncbi:hypothetical protein GY45DRAFT_1321813 [Cubamyces sp. BRFM 1775]|nr:hypothetical protein GY45DRAFT_1321813 [Cubamyces sp. BRFM 1775]